MTEQKDLVTATFAVSQDELDMLHSVYELLKLSRDENITSGLFDPEGSPELDTFESFIGHQALSHISSFLTSLKHLKYRCRNDEEMQSSLVRKAVTAHIQKDFSSITLHNKKFKGKK